MGMYFLHPGYFNYLVWQYGPRFMRIWFTQFVSGNVERANRGLRLRFHLTFWRQGIYKKKRDAMNDTTFITGVQRGRRALWADSSQAVPACSGVVITMATRNGNYKFQKPHIAYATAICRNPQTHNSTGERQKLYWSSVDRHVSMLHFYQNTRTNNFVCGNNIFTEFLFVSKLSRNAGISLWPVVWVTTTCCVLSDFFTECNCIWLSI